MSPLRDLGSWTCDGCRETGTIAVRATRDSIAAACLACGHVVALEKCVACGGQGVFPELGDGFGLAVECVACGGTGQSRKGDA